MCMYAQTESRSIDIRSLFIILRIDFFSTLAVQQQMRHAANNQSRCTSKFPSFYVQLELLRTVV